MKNALAFALLLALAVPLPARAQFAADDAALAPAAAAEPPAEVSLDTFRGALAPYGTWTELGGYGPVWRPAVAPGWKPYYYGHWAWSDAGWTWVSEEPWGWAPYHYGRWGFDSALGWFWVPGYQWAPAWVSWRYSAGVVGWAPLLPGASLYVGTSPALYAAWTFVPGGAFVGYPAYRHAYPLSAYATCFRGTLPAPPRGAPHGARAPAFGGPAPGLFPRAPAPVHPVAAPPPASGRPVATPVYRPAPPPVHGSPAPRPAGPTLGSAFPGGRTRLPLEARGPESVPRPAYGGAGRQAPAPRPAAIDRRAAPGGATQFAFAPRGVGSPSAGAGASRGGGRRSHG
ncbi:MAG TPA: DUF6600 domain-containing protein [Anaeromyxobacteraceae bacterium]|nr:DUF6600 domain-containing protein [Anaeromyxobacteraceae bacterium]